MKVFGAIRLALMVWAFTKLQLLAKRADEIDEIIDNLGIDATKSDMLRIKRLTSERRRINQLLSLADTVFSEKH